MAVFRQDDKHSGHLTCDTRTRREVNILNRLRCPYVLNFIGASHVEGKRCIVTELCKHGTRLAAYPLNAPHYSPA
jgi:hypothetical protein